MALIASLEEKEKVRLIHVPVQDPSYNLPNLELQCLDFEGDYFSLLRLYNQLQHQEAIGAPRSLRFKKTKATQMPKAGWSWRF